MTRRIAYLTGDWHMKSGGPREYPDMYGDAAFGLRQIVYYATKNKLPVIAAGDLFHTKNPGLDIMVETMLFLKDLPGCYVQGNHEKRCPSWMTLVAPHWVPLQDNMYEIPFSPRTLLDEYPDEKPNPEQEPLFDRDRTWLVHGLDYVLSIEELQTGLDRLEAALCPASDTANLLVLHQAASPFQPKNYCELLDGMLPDAIDLVLIGDTHEAGIAPLESKSGRRIPCLSPGGTYIVKINENPNKKLYTLYADGSIRSRPLLTRRRIVKTLRGMSDEQLYAVVEQLAEALRTGRKRPDEIAKPIVYLELDSETSVHAESILSDSFHDQAHLYFKRVTENEQPESEPVDTDEIDLDNHSGDRQVLDLLQKREEDETILRLVGFMLDNEPVYESYERMKHHFLETYHVENQAGQAGELLQHHVGRR